MNAITQITAGKIQTNQWLTSQPTTLQSPAGTQCNAAGTIPGVSRSTNRPASRPALPNDVLVRMLC